MNNYSYQQIHDFYKKYLGDDDPQNISREDLLEMVVDLKIKYESKDIENLMDAFNKEFEG